MAALGLRPLAPEPGFAAAAGSFKGAEVRLEARAWSGGPIAFARFVELSGGALEIANALCLPHPRFALPIFGADFVAVTEQAAMFAADLSPVPGAAPASPLVHGLPPGGALPEWCTRVFSPHPLFVRVGPERRAEASAAALALVERFCALAASPPPAAREAETAEAQRAYARAHLEDDRGLAMLARMFGAAWAGRFLREVMFPAPPG